MLGVDDDGHRPVIDQSDPHMRAETTFLHRHSPGGFGYSLQYDFHGSLQYKVCSHQPVTYATDW